MAAISAPTAAMLDEASFAERSRHRSAVRPRRDIRIRYRLPDRSGPEQSFSRQSSAVSYLSTPSRPSCGPLPLAHKKAPVLGGGAWGQTMVYRYRPMRVFPTMTTSSVMPRDSLAWRDIMGAGGEGQHRIGRNLCLQSGKKRYLLSPKRGFWQLPENGCIYFGHPWAAFPLRAKHQAAMSKPALHPSGSRKRSTEKLARRAETVFWFKMHQGLIGG